MERPTRSQVQERNRETVVRVARDAFLRDGYLATSLASVAAEAGFTTGIVYSAFGSKAELALTVLRAVQSEQISSFGAQVRGSVSSDDLLDRVRVWARDATDSGWVRFELELLLDSLVDERLAEAQVARQLAAVMEVAGVLRTITSLDAMDDVTVEVLAEATVDYAIGVGIRQVVNRDASPDRFLRVMAPLVTLLDFSQLSP